MSKYLLFISLILFSSIIFAQNKHDNTWINYGQEGWGPGQWLQITPGKMGPNALPVPRMDYAMVGNKHKIEIGADYHYMPGDTSVNSFVSFYWSVVPGKVAVEIYGQPSETFRTSNELRSKRQIWYNDPGWKTIPGDLLVSTYIQIVRDRKFIPDISISYTIKSSTGDNKDARYTNASMNYYCLAMGKSFKFNNALIDAIRVAGFGGFYVWETNINDMAQDEGPVYQLGLQLQKAVYSVFAEIGGYSAYGAYNHLEPVVGQVIEDYNDPLILRGRIEKTGSKFNIKAEYQTGLNYDYPYQTFRLGLVYKFVVN
ncbi:MAG: hypothetical protein PF436_12615 [Prolixibacteraceae bacterium]|jgi:hypothetical protein|nr:hypothetical protein [Prolixibacteraceae bacterium]